MIFVCNVFAVQAEVLTAAGSVSLGLKGDQVGAVEVSGVEGGEVKKDPSCLQRSWMLNWMLTNQRYASNEQILSFIVSTLSVNFLWIIP